MKRIIIFLLTGFPLLGFSQLNDNFTDGDFTNNPTWTGDISEFIVNGSQQLQLNNTIAGASYLSTSNSISLNGTVEWIMYVKQTFSPSSSNFGRVYLVSDQANLEGSLNGYYVQFGEAGAADAVEIFRQNGLASTSVARGTNGEIAASFTVGVKVTKDALGLWTLFVDATGGTNYVFEASGTDLSFTSSAFFGVSATYTLSNANKFFFDDFTTVATVVVDTIPPNLLSTNVISGTQLDVLFSEAIDSASGNDTAHYFVNNAVGHPLSAFRDISNLSLVHLTFPNPFVNGQLDSLFVDSISDLNANVLISDTATFTYTAVFTASYKDVIVNEIFADISPVVGLPPAEFVEILNRSSNPINLNNWSFHDNILTTTSNLTNYILLPDSFVVLCSTTNAALFSGISNVIGITSFPTLNDAGDHIYLRSDLNSIIDSVNYTDAWYQDVTKSSGGWTLELKNPDININCAQAVNWIASNNANGGTPGVQNSVFSNAPDITPPAILSVIASDSVHVSICFNEAIDASQIGILTNYTINNSVGNPIAIAANSSFTCVDLTLAVSLVSQQSNTITFTNIADCSGNNVTPNSAAFIYFAPIIAAPKEILLTEIFADISPVIGLPAAEFVELFNRSSNPINLNNWSFHDDINSTTPNISNYVLLPDSFVVLCSTSNAALFTGISNVLGITSFPSLNDAGDHLYLRSNLGSIIDSVPYTDDWYRDAVKKGGGWSLELINPGLNVNCAPAANWIASNNVNGGTPGKQNSVYSIALDITAPSIITVFAVDSMHITVCMSEAMDASQINVLSNYIVDGGIGNPITVVPNSGLSCVDLTLGVPLVSQQLYTITLSNLGDCSGNIVNPNSAIFVYYTPVVAKPKDIVINEIYSSPTTTSGLPNTEYLEVYNRTNTPINLGGWSIQDDTTGAVNITNYILLPDSFLIICSATKAGLFPTNISVLGIASFPSLNNTGDHIYLKNNLGSIVDDVNYSDSWYRSNTKKVGGWSLELIDPGFTCTNKLNWIASTHPRGGTPGRLNSVNGIFTDTQAPSLLRAITTSNSSIKLFFDEPVKYSALTNITTYTFDNNIVLPLTTQFSVNSDSTEVNIVLPITLQLKKIYTVTVNANIADCAGNTVSADNSAQFGIGEEPDSLDIVINEIMYNPVAGGTDFFEIYNRSTKTIDLSQLFLSSKDTLTNALIKPATIASEGYLMFPGNYLLLSENTAVVKSQYATTNPKGFWQMDSIPSFNITDGTVVLSTPQQKIIDDLHYYDTWQFPLLVSSKGVSLERINFNRTTQDGSNWHSASQNVGFGTPAYRNSQYSENATSANDEIAIEPEVFSPDNDGYQDVVNITYKTDNPGYTGSITIFDERGRLIRSLVKNELWGSTGTYSWDGITNDRDKARIGIYVVLVEVFDLSGNTRQYKKVCVVGAKL